MGDLLLFPSHELFFLSGAFALPTCPACQTPVCPGEPVELAPDALPAQTAYHAECFRPSPSMPVPESP